MKTIALLILTATLLPAQQPPGSSAPIQQQIEWQQREIQRIRDEQQRARLAEQRARLAEQRAAAARQPDQPPADAQQPPLDYAERARIARQVMQDPTLTPRQKRILIEQISRP